MPYSADILVIEDDLNFCSYLKDVLSFNGYTIHVAQNGREALRCVSRENADLILMDIGLPDIDGRDLLKQIAVKTPETPVILMTGNASIDSATDALKAGAYDYLAKPVDHPKLLKTIENVLDRNRIERQYKEALIRLGESEAKYHSLFDNITDALTIIDAETLKFEDANQAALDLYGYTREEFCRLTVEDISAEKDKTRRALKKVKQGKKGSRFVPVRYQRKKDGTVFPVEISAASHVSGGRLKIIGAIRDISDRMAAQKELLKTKARMKHLLVSSPAIIYVLKPDDNSISYISDNVKDTLGYRWMDLIGDAELWMSRVHPDDIKVVELAIARQFEAGKQVCEYRFMHQDGSYRWIRDESRLIYDGEGLPLEVIGSFIDVTDAKTAEQELRQSEERFRNLVENSLIGISIIQNNQFVYKNPAQKQIRGSRNNEKLSDLTDHIYPGDLDKVRTAYKKIISGEIDSFDVDFRFYVQADPNQKSGMRWAQCRASTIEYQGKPAILLNTVDLTKTKELEQQLIIKNKMVSLGRVTAGIAHEIRNPLSGINSYLYTLKDICQFESLSPEHFEMSRQILDQIQIASDKIESVIKRVMDFSKPGTPRMEKTDINLSIETAVKLSDVALRKKGIRIETSLGQNLPKCYADPQLIEQVILNLITNAANAVEKCKDPKLVGVDSYTSNNTLFIRVSDSGAGIPLALKDKIFDPFFTTREEGSGIGLNIAQRIIADHNGNISLGKSKWGGAEFTIRLPIERRVYPR